MGDVVAMYSAIMRMNAARRTAAATERRRRRYQVRRRANGRGEGAGVGEGEGGSAAGYPVVAEGIPLAAPGGVRVGVQAPQEEAVEVERENPVPVVGALAMAGRTRYMEDAIRIKSRLCSPAINGFVPVHYFAVFDGHGGSHFSVMCKEKMHGILEEELMGVYMQQNHTSQHSHPAPPRPRTIADETLLQETWRRVMCRCFARTEAVALQTCHCGSVGFHCRCGRSAAEFTGTAAVAIVLTQKHIVAANCGDSRAVLFRGGRIVPLTFDHKPDRRDEVARIALSGGRVLGVDTPRVQGILAMTRAIGDNYLKPHVISEPEVTFTRRDEEDEFIIIATDGLWDVISTQMACEITQECLQEAGDNVGVHINFPGLHGGPGIGPRGNVEGPSPMTPSRSTSAAALLSLLAMTRHSQDNISVIVIDLKKIAGDDQDDDSLSNIEF